MKKLFLLILILFTPILVCAKDTVDINADILDKNQGCYNIVRK